MRKEILELIGHINDVDIYPAPHSIEYDPMDLALPEEKMISKRLCEYILAQPVCDLSWQRLFGQFRSDGSVNADVFSRSGHPYFGKCASIFYNKPYDELVTFEWQHSTPNYERIILRGFNGCLSDIASSKALHKNEPDKISYLEALEEMCNGMIAWAHKCAEECKKAAVSASDKRRKELLKSSERLMRVPEFSARTFAEALQTIYICFDMLPDSIGTIDRFLYPFYKKDIESGVITRDEAKELLQELYLRLQCRTPVNSNNRKRGGECHFAIGGYTDGGEDGFNDLSRLIVEALMEMPMHIPEISLRWTEKTPREVLRFMLDCERNDVYKRIALVNDEPRIKCFTEYLGLSRYDAIRYTMVGCNEPAFQGTMWFGGSTATCQRGFTRLLYNDTEKAVACNNFDEFYSLFEEYFKKDIDELIDISDKFNAMRAKDVNVLSALMLDGCIESGLSPLRGGCRIKLGGAEFMGTTSLIDSLTVIKQFVFDEKLFTMGELIENLKSNWQKDPDMRTVIMKKARYFGNNEKISDNMAVRFTDTLYKFTKNRYLAGGERILYGTLAGYNVHYATYGALTPATPDGRFNGEAFTVGCGQAFGRDRKGVTALLSSVAQMQPSGILCGPFVLNVTLEEKLIRDDAYFEKTVDEIETYFKAGGMHIQLNYITAEELLEAKRNPAMHENLKVRVSGWSGVFVELDDEIQQNVIKRTVKGL